jgi:predicted N-acyltransferase
MKQANDAPVYVEIVSQPNAAIIDEVFSLFWQTYEKGNTKFEQLNRVFFDEISQYENSHYVILRKNESKEMLSFMLCFKLGEHVVNKFIGIDYSQPKEWFLYFRLWDAAVEWSYSIGATSIQSGQTGYAPKIELGNDMVPLSNYCQHKNPIVNFIYQMVAKTINWDTLDPDLAIYVKAYPELKPANLK